MPRFASTAFSAAPASCAAIDMGTNTFRLLIAEIKDGASLQTMYSENQTVRLGEGFSKRKHIRPAALQRAIAALNGFREILQKNAISSVVVTGTSAVRDAENREAFLAEIKAQCGFKVEVLSGKEEARLTLSGVGLVFHEAEKADKARVVIDIGGGSTELIQAQAGQSPFFLSLNLGAVTLSEAYLHNDPPTSKEMQELQEAIMEVLFKIVRHFPKHCRFAGTAGTVTSLAAIEQEMDVYDPERINGYQMSRTGISNILKRLKSVPTEQRQKIPGLEAGRADIIIAGTVILLSVMEVFSYDSICVSDYGLREGVLIERFGRGLA